MEGIFVYGPAPGHLHLSIKLALDFFRLVQWVLLDTELNLIEPEKKSDLLGHRKRCKTRVDPKLKYYEEDII